MQRTIVDEEELGRRVISDVKARFKEMAASGAVEAGEDFVQARVSIEFIVSAKKKKPKPEPEPEPEPCCVCYRVPGGIICGGDCCGDVIGAEPDIII
ncbi:hypothetical protein [Plantactinospora sp. GCM10030261]|uniref:hypothetical protein n=1 Tax=Plantactinospora sp. GCM10030261 TaxID=3273420 RepID=UPI00361B10DA